jgi:A/G-specific adenine glycosylase
VIRGSNYSDSFPLDARLSSRLQHALYRWFRHSGRDLPWRRDRDPYRIWVSEIMLQQTQVATVIPFFERFIEAFPDLPALAVAREQDVLRAWEGLGYYRRARNLHQAARRVLADHRGQIPDDPAVLRSLPGIGRYTMGAILSQAFDRRLPILEANSERVLCRLFGRRDDPRRGPARRWLWAVAEQMLPKRYVGQFNQALMELGALVCTAAKPRCEVCPVAGMCVARRLRIEEKIPHRRAVPDTQSVHESAVVVRKGSRLLLVQRPDNGRWSGLWEFPRGPLEKGESHEEAARRLARELTGLQAEVGRQLLTIHHSVTHHRITLVCFEATYRKDSFRSEFYRKGRWIKPAELVEYPVSAPQRRLAGVLVESGTTNHTNNTNKKRPHGIVTGLVAQALFV